MDCYTLVVLEGLADLGILWLVGRHGRSQGGGGGWVLSGGGSVYKTREGCNFRDWGWLYEERSGA